MTADLERLGQDVLGIRYYSVKAQIIFRYVIQVGKVFFFFLFERGFKYYPLLLILLLLISDVVLNNIDPDQMFNYYSTKPNW